MWTELYWISLPGFLGRLAMAPRPRGGDWLADELAAWKRQGVTNVVSLLMAAEAAEFGLTSEAELCHGQGIEFDSLPIPDRGLPPDVNAFVRLAAKLADRIEDPYTVVVHCRQGIGRAGMLAAGTLMVLGFDRKESIRLASEARGREVPETDEQRQWLDEHITVGWPKPGPSEAQLEELDRRIADFDANPDDWVSWEEIKTDDLRRYKR